MSLTARTPPVGAISDVEKVACLVVCAVSALCCIAVIYCNTAFPVLRQPPGLLGVDAPAPRARSWSPFW